MSVSGESRGHGAGLVLELGVSFAVTVGFLVTCAPIHVNAMVRPGQVSALAAVDLRLVCFGLVGIGVLLFAAKRRGEIAFDRATALVCAAIAGLASAGVAGGIMAILHRTEFALGGYLGDTAVLADWADRLKRGETVSPIYPPMQVYWIVWLTKLFSFDSLYAVKYFQILGVALLGPLSYAAWRLLLRPVAALGVGVVASLPLIEAFRPYPMLVLMIFVPLIVKFLDVLRRSSTYHPIELARAGTLFGLAFALSFLMYSGWVQWSAPGILIAGIYFMPWRNRPSHGWVLVGVTAIVFAIVSFNYLRDVMHAPPIHDDFMYFDATIDPAYFTMWRGGMPGAAVSYLSWPPPGELGNVGVFTLLLCVGTGLAIAVGPRKTLVIALAVILAGVWLFRLYYAHRLYETKLVQLYPRTSAEMLYVSLILGAYGVYLLVERARARAAPDSPLLARSAVIGFATAMLALVIASASATTDHYMPNSDGQYLGHLAWTSLSTPLLEADQTEGAKLNSSDEPADAPDHEEWIEIHLPTVRAFNRAVLHPAEDGFPIDFELDVWNGLEWLPRVKVTNQAVPDKSLSLRWVPPDPNYTSDYTNAFRIKATKLRRVGDGYGLRMAKIELYQ